MNVEEIITAWNPAAHNNLREVLRLWEIVQEIKTYGNGEIRIIVRDSTIVSAETERKWVNKGQDFSECEL